jgi:hypothetical protein
MPEPVALTILFAIAFFLNIPLGMLRRRSRRWTLPWIIGCDGSVPILILLRKYVLDVGGWEVILPEVLLALAGNIYGPRLLLRFRRQGDVREAEPVAAEAT